MRDNLWLAARLAHIQAAYFPDVAVPNTIQVRFGRASRTRFGSIIAKPKSGYRLPVTLISINALFKDEEVPEYVIDATLGHEFAHYAHGFHSPHERQFPHPHRGGVVDKELQKRGMGEILERQNRWAKERYPAFLRKHGMI